MAAFLLVLWLVNAITTYSLDPGSWASHWLIGSGALTFMILLSTYFGDRESIKKIAEHRDGLVSADTLGTARGFCARIAVLCLLYAALSLIYAGLPTMLGVSSDALSAGNTVIESMFMFNSIVLLIGVGVSAAAAINLKHLPLSPQD